MDGETSLLDHKEKEKEDKNESKEKEVENKRDSKQKELENKRDSKQKEVENKRDSKQKEVENKRDSKQKERMSSSNNNLSGNSSSNKINITNYSNHSSSINNGNLPNHLLPVENQGKSSKKNSSANSPTSGNNTQTSISSNLISRRSTFRKRHSDINVLVGTPIKEDHVHYVLMYDMLTGIRVAVSRCLAKAERPLQDQDFHAAHKLAFDIIGNELTPSSKYDFKFKDYAPWVFRSIRDICNIDQADYLMSLTGKYVLSELGSPGKSGSFFYYSQDYRFIIKTIHHCEHKFLRKILKEYYEHIRDNPNTLICWIFGLHRVKLPHGRKIHFVVMQNILPPNKDIHERFDLKGSTKGRIVPDEVIKKDKSVVLKDINWIKLRRRIKLGPEKRKLFIEQIEKDAKLLAKLNIMDYSLLVGFHNLKKGNQENIRDKTLSIFEPNPESLSQQLAKVRQGSKAVVIRKAIAESDPVALGPSTTKLPEKLPEERKKCIFYQDDGGYQATDNNNKPLKDLYFLGIIDTFTNYNYKKKIEHLFKAMKYEKTEISAVNPTKYAKRFVDFIKFATYPEEELNDPIFEPYIKIRNSFNVQYSDEVLECTPIVAVADSKQLNNEDNNKKEESKSTEPTEEVSKDTTPKEPIVEKPKEEEETKLSESFEEKSKEEVSLNESSEEKSKTEVKPSESADEKPKEEEQEIKPTEPVAEKPNEEEQEVKPTEPVAEKPNEEEQEVKPTEPVAEKPKEEEQEVKPTEPVAEKPKEEEQEAKPSESTNEKQENEANIIPNEPVVEKTEEEAKPGEAAEEPNKELEDTNNITEEYDDSNDEIFKSITSMDSGNDGSYADYTSQFKDFIPIIQSKDIFLSPKSDSPLTNKEEEIITPLPQAHIQSNLSSKRESMKIDPAINNSGTLS